jgi:hypothetical protein
MIKDPFFCKHSLKFKATAFLAVALNSNKNQIKNKKRQIRNRIAEKCQDTRLEITKRKQIESKF